MVQQLPQSFQLFTYEDKLQILVTFLHILPFTYGQISHFPPLKTAGRKHGSKYRNYTDSTVPNATSWCFKNPVRPLKTEVTVLENFQFFVNFQIKLTLALSLGTTSLRVHSCPSVQAAQGHGKGEQLLTGALQTRSFLISHTGLHGGFPSSKSQILQEAAPVMQHSALS